MIDSEGEKKFFDTHIKDNVKIIFDVGALWSDYPEYECEVHYFEPRIDAMEELKGTEPNNNTKSVYNCVGLGDEVTDMDFYGHGAFFSRESCRNNNIIDNLPITRGDMYMLESGVKTIDYLKIDVEGFELNVLKGFGDELQNVKYIQFEYGVGLRDAGYSLIDIVTHLRKYGFNMFGRIMSDGELELITDYTDDWVWGNLIAYRGIL